MIKKFNYLIQSIIVYILFIVGRILGLQLSRKIFSFLFVFVGPFFRSKKIVEKNIQIFEKENTLINKQEVISNMWRNYGMTFIEYAFLNIFRKSNTEVTIKNKSFLSEIARDKGPVIFISGHLANFELMSMEITKNKIPLATIYRPLNNIFLNPFMEYLRKKYVCKNQIKKGINGVRKAIEFINNNHSVALMIDQRLSEGIHCKFFGEKALTTTLPSQLSLKYNLDIVPVYIERNINNHFIIEFLERIDPRKFKNKKELTQKLNVVLEDMIKRNPNQWIWTHNRWK